MAIEITCLEASEYINDDIDGRLPAEVRSAFEAHLGRCRPCSLERSLALGAKSTLAARMGRVPLPDDLRDGVLGAIRAAAAGIPVPERAASHAASHAPAAAARRAGDAKPARLALSRFTAWRVPLAFAGALGMALVAMLFLTRHQGHDHTRPSDGNVVTENFNTFDEVVTGRLAPGFVSDDPVRVKEYLEERVHFPISMPAMKEFRLVGARFTAVDRETTAHVIYERDGSYLYLSQTDARKLLRGERRYIPPDAIADIQKSGWHFVGNVTDCNLAMWLADSTLCTAVADLNRDVMLANLAGFTVR